MVKSKNNLVRIMSFLFVMIFLFINNSLSEAKESEFPATIGLKDMNNFLYKEPGIINQVNNKLAEEGYVFSTLIVAYSKQDIQMKIILSNREATETEQVKVKSTFYELVGKTNLDPNAFSLKVSDYDDGPDW